jgi:hypothetical protein
MTTNAHEAHPRDPFVLELLAAVGTGKTALLLTILNYASLYKGDHFLRLQDHESQALLEQNQRRSQGLCPTRTLPTDGAELDERGQQLEWMPLLIEVKGQTYPFHIVAHAGEEPRVQIRSQKAKDLADLASRYDQRRILGLLVHPGLMNPDTATLWFKCLIAHLCQLYKDCSTQIAAENVPGKITVLRTAIETAAWANFGISAFAAQKPGDGAAKLRTLHAWHPSIKGLFLNLPDDARLIRGHNNDFFLKSDELDTTQCIHIVRALDLIAKNVCEDYLRELNAFRSLAEQAVKVLILMTRMDTAKLLNLDEIRLRHECEGYFKKDFRRYQVISLDHMSIGFEQDYKKAALAHLAANGDRNESVWPNPPSLDDETRNKSQACEALFNAVGEVIAQQEQGKHRPAQVQVHDKPTHGSMPADRVAEAAFVTLRETPFVLAACFIAAWFHSEWAYIWHFLMGGIVFVVLRWLYVLLTSFHGPGAWQIHGDTNDADLRVSVDLTIFQVPPGEIQVCESFVSNLFGVGWVQWKGRQVRIAGMRRFLQLTGAQLERTPVHLFVDSTQVLLWAASFVIVVSNLVKSF